MNLSGNIGAATNGSAKKLLYLLFVAIIIFGVSSIVGGYMTYVSINLTSQALNVLENNDHKLNIAIHKSDRNYGALSDATTKVINHLNESSDVVIDKLLGILIPFAADSDEDIELMKPKLGISRDDPNDHIKITFNSTMINIANKSFIPLIKGDIGLNKTG